MRVFSVSSLLTCPLTYLMTSMVMLVIVLMEVLLVISAGEAEPPCQMSRWWGVESYLLMSMGQKTILGPKI